MADDHARNELAQLRTLVESQQARLAHLERRRPRLPRRVLPLALVALLVLLTPLATFAAGFTDLNPGSPHNDNIAAIAAAGITKGCNPPDYTNYCPNDLVTREQMASFLARTAGLGSNPPVANAKTVGGKAPSDLARVARATGPIAPPFATLNNTGFTPVTTIAINAPAAGFVLVVASASFGSASAANTTTFQLRDAATGGATSPTILSNVAASPATNSIATTYVFPVAGPGTYTYVFEGETSTGTDKAGFGGISALYVPFGSTGAGTLGTAESAPVPAPGANPWGQP